MKLFKSKRKKKTNPQEENWGYIINKKDLEKAADKVYRKNRRKDFIKAIAWRLLKITITLVIVYGLVIFSFQIPIIGPLIKSRLSLNVA